GCNALVRPPESQYRICPYLQRRIQTIAQPLRATVCSSAGCQRSRCGKDLRRKLSQDPRTELSDSLKEKRGPIIQRDSAVNRRVVGSSLTWGAIHCNIELAAGLVDRVVANNGQNDRDAALSGRMAWLDSAKVLARGRARFSIFVRDERDRIVGRANLARSL